MYPTANLKAFAIARLSPNFATGEGAPG